MNRKASYVVILTMIITLSITIFFIQISPVNGVSEESGCSEFVAFVKEIFENVGDLGENQYRYDVKDDQENWTHTIKILENPEGGYLGVYHTPIDKDKDGVADWFVVKLGISDDLLNWTLVRDVEANASQPAIALAPNGAFIVAFEKEDASSHLQFQYYSNLSTLINGPPDATLDANRTLSRDHEGTPNVYNITIKDSTISACIGFHYDNGFVDNVAVGWLTIPLDNPQSMVWNNTKPLTRYNQDLMQVQVRGNIGDRDYEQVFGRNFTLQEGNLHERWPETNYAAWRIFLYNHLTSNFTMLNIKTHNGSTSFGNPTFTFLKGKSPNEKDRIVVTYFLFSEGAALGEAGQLIFYKEFNRTDEEIPYEDKVYPLTIYSNSTISNFNFNQSQKSINFNVTGPDGSKGYCIVKLLNNLVQDLWQDNYTVLLNGGQCPFDNWTNTENAYLYINYTHSELKVTIVPEFSSAIMLPLLTIATLLIISLQKKRSNPSAICKPKEGEIESLILNISSYSRMLLKPR